MYVGLNDGDITPDMSQNVIKPEALPNCDPSLEYPYHSCPHIERVFTCHIP